MLYVCMYMYVRVSVYVCMHVYLCLYIYHMYVCVCVCVVCVYLLNVRFQFSYVCGIASDCEKLFRRCHLETHEWELLADYPEQPRVQPPVINYCGMLYLLPSLLECRTRVVSSVHVFDPAHDSWTMTVVRELRPHIFAYGVAAIHPVGQ
jgi:hypothetical protein